MVRGTPFLSVIVTRRSRRARPEWRAQSAELDDFQRLGDELELRPERSDHRVASHPQTGRAQGREDEGERDLCDITPVKKNRGRGRSNDP
ncbi:hypothetical protein EYF80_051354 [Liparis tanakae]|uniref:Uncharacterized protein n=1 Tax=Liparis tanakae TaxID=230148 RepID=A0A4Z2FB66_9TELE|nr:hypothetical protein EYF80_051354 [Liparis tanakae]